MYCFNLHFMYVFFALIYIYVTIMYYYHYQLHLIYVKKYIKWHCCTRSDIAITLREPASWARSRLSDLNKGWTDQILSVLNRLWLVRICKWKYFYFFSTCSTSGDITTQNTNLKLLRNVVVVAMEWGKCPFGIFGARGKCGADTWSHHTCLFSVTDDELVYTFGNWSEIV